MALMINKNVNVSNIKTDNEGFITAYASVFDVVDYDGDKVQKGAFIESLKTKTPVMLWNHDSSQPIGKWMKISEDEKGLYVEGQLLINESEKANEVYKLIKSGAISGLSIGFTVDDYTYDGDNRSIKRVTLFEISIVSIPCNDEARIIQVKSFDNITCIRDMENFFKNKGFSSKESKAIISTMKKVLTKDIIDKVVNQLKQINILNKLRYMKNVLK